MTTLLCFGFGYCAEHYLRSFGSKFDRTVGTVRSVDRAKALNETYGGRLQAVVFDGRTVTSGLCRAVNEADALLVSAPPDENGDPVLRVLTDELINAADLRSIVYLSTIGVYGDCGGAWVDESTEAKPGSVRGRARLAAEQAWQQLGTRRGAAVAILRLAGIYGPGQNALLQVASGKARRIVKPGQIFNRIHVGDIAQAIDAAFTHRASGIFNVADDEPTPLGEPMMFAAQLLGVAPPPEVSFESAAATMSPMALSFWQECRRVHNDALKRTLGVSLLYPTYREGLRALLAAQQVSAGSGP
jgi:nucleoside-diphosphate-sugar epimerase